jgi:hypothetical protein
MVLYVSVVLLAELAALPEQHFADGHVEGVIGGPLVAAIWGTAIGLALAHWFAFVFAADELRGLRPARHDLLIGLAQFAGAAFVGAVLTLALVLLPDSAAVAAMGELLAAIIGVIAYFIARATGHGRAQSVIYGVTVLVLGVVVAIAKYRLSAH